MSKVIIFVIAALSLFSFSCKGSVAQETKVVSASSLAKKLALDFELADLKGGKFALSSYKGKNPVLLFFWTTECPLCGDELPVLNKMYPELAKEGLVVALVNAGEDPQMVADYIKMYPGMGYPVLLDMSFSVVKKYKVFGVPTYILIDKDGFIVFTGHSFSLAKFKKLIY